MPEQREESEFDNDAYVREVHDKGLKFDLQTLNRRRMLTVVGGAGLVAVAGTQVLSSNNPASAASCAAEVESETGGPYPADGTNGPNVRTTSGVVRSDIRSSFGSASGTATGVTLTIALTVLNSSCSPYAGAAVYAWHCDAVGRYSLYSSGVTTQNYLRGIQVADSTGTLKFTSIYPGCYSGRWPHIHFEVYSSLSAATGTSSPIKTSQIALPQSTSATVYASSGYGNSASALSRISLASDMVFADDLAAREMATVTGSVSAGYTAALTVTVKG